MLLIDEIALTQDSVLERMNSIFEDSRILVLSEKNSDNIETIIPNDNFKILATMNPAGNLYLYKIKAIMEKKSYLLL